MGENILAMRGLFTKGYGLIPKKIMVDDRLDIEAKAIYAYLMSYAGAGETAYPSVSLMLKHLKISEKTYYKYFRQLTNSGYIKVTQAKSGDNKFMNNIYEIVADPDTYERERMQNRHDEIEFIINTFIGYFQARYKEVNGVYEKPISENAWRKIKFKLCSAISYKGLSLKSLEAKANRFFIKHKGKGIKEFAEVI